MRASDSRAVARGSGESSEGARKLRGVSERVHLLRPTGDVCSLIGKEARRDMHIGEVAALSEGNERGGLPYGVVIGKLDASVAGASAARSKWASLGIALGG